MDNVENRQYWSFEKRGNIIWLGLDKPASKVNSLTLSILTELDQIINVLSEEHSASAVVFYSKKQDSFIVGADIEQFLQLDKVYDAELDKEVATDLSSMAKSLETADKDADEHEAKGEFKLDVVRYGLHVLQRIEDLPHKTIALINGHCLGGGLELSLACKHRIALDGPKVLLGLPEVKLGLHPGWGGTVRLTKMLGAVTAMQLILTGRMISAKAAYRLGLVDACVPARLAEKTVQAFVEDKLKQKKASWLQHLFTWFSYEDYRLYRRFLGYFLELNLKKKVSEEHYPAPFKVIKNWIKYGVSKAAYAQESKTFHELLHTDTSKNLVKVYFLQEGLKKAMVDAVKSNKLQAKELKVHVLGSGTMGADIAACCLLKGCEVSVQDTKREFLAKGYQRIAAQIQGAVKEQHSVQQHLDRLSLDLHGNYLAEADFVLEAVSESTEVKCKLFEQLEHQVKPDAVLATNTSTIPLAEIAKGMQQPDRLVGIHFFNPVAKMPLVEIVYAKTKPEVIALAHSFVLAIGKLPIQVKSSPGFLVNRILLPYMLEAVTMLEEGVKKESIDKAAEEFGLAVGPIELMDFVGLDICQAALNKVAEKFAIITPAILTEKVAENKLGLKTQEGFYKYKNGKPIKGNSQFSVESFEDIMDRLVYRLIKEAALVMQEEIVGKLAELDAASIFGFGFAPFRGGIANYVKDKGVDKIIARMQELEVRYGEGFAVEEGTIGLLVEHAK